MARLGLLLAVLVALGPMRPAGAQGALAAGRAGAAPPRSESLPATPPLAPDLRSRIESLLREHESGLPQAWSVRPNPLYLGLGKVGVLLVSGVHLDRVVSAAVVSPSGTPSRTLRPLLYRDPGSDPRTVLFLILPAPPKVSPGEYRLQLNAADGGTYVPRGVGRLLIEEPHDRGAPRAERPDR